MAVKIHPIFKKIKDITTENINLLSTKIHDDVFSKIDCLDCGNCCKSAPPLIINSDIKRISRHLNLSKKQFTRKYIIEDFNGEMSFSTIPCTFLLEDNKCSIYEIRPDACRDYPHINSGNFKKRRKIHSINIDICPAVEKILDRMEKEIEKKK